MLVAGTLLTSAGPLFLLAPAPAERAPAPAVEGSGRRALILQPAAAWAAAGLLALAPEARAAAEKEPLPPPVVKDIKSYADKIQEGMDSLYFELKPALVKEDLFIARQYLGSAMTGSHISPLQTNMLIPMENLLSSNLDSEEDGWTKAVRKMSASVDDIKEYVGSADWKQARASWEDARANAFTVIVDMNERADKAYFTPPDADYEAKRFNIWLQKRKDDIRERNNKGSMAIAR